MIDAIRQILEDTRRLLQYNRELGVDRLPAGPELRKFLGETAPADAASPDDRRAPAAPSRETTPDQPLREIANEVAACTLCPLHLQRRQPVVGSGTGRSGLLLIEDQPGEAEETGGAPFSGEAGELFDRMLKAINLSRDEVRLTTLVKCRPPADRDPAPAEIQACRNYLARELAALKPAVICVMGTLAAHLLTGSDQPLFRLRGTFHDFHGTPLLVTFHPRFLLRNPEMKKACWQDLQLIEKKLRNHKR